MRKKNKNFPVVSLFDAQAMGLLRVPVECDPSAQISRVFTPPRHPNSVVLRTNQFWLEVDDPDVRRYLLGYLARPQWKDRSWDEMSSIAFIPENRAAFKKFHAEEARVFAEINATLTAIDES